MSRQTVSQEELLTIINDALAAIDPLDADCRDCRMATVYRLAAPGADG